jgi:hypothetical protein
MMYWFYPFSLVFCFSIKRRFSSITFRNFWSINSFRATPPFRAMGRNASRNGFVIRRHMQSRSADKCSHADGHGWGNNWVLIEEQTFQLEAAYLGPGRKGGCTSSDRLLRFHFKQVEPAKLYFAQFLRSLRGLRGLWRD